MNNSALPHGIDREPLFRHRSPRERPEKTFPRFMMRNPLKSLDSDERIQGNPRKSKEIQRPSIGVLAAKRPRPKKNPNGPTWSPLSGRSPTNSIESRHALDAASPR